MPLNRSVLLERVTPASNCCSPALALWRVATSLVSAASLVCSAVISAASAGVPAAPVLPCAPNTIDSAPSGIWHRTRRRSVHRACRHTRATPRPGRSTPPARHPQRPGTARQRFQARHKSSSACQPSRPGRPGQHRRRAAASPGLTIVMGHPGPPSGRARVACLGSADRRARLGLFTCAPKSDQKCAKDRSAFGCHHGPPSLDAGNYGSGLGTSTGDGDDRDRDPIANRAVTLTPETAAPRADSLPEKRPSSPAPVTLPTTSGAGGSSCSHPSGADTTVSSLGGRE